MKNSSIYFARSLVMSYTILNLKKKLKPIEGRPQSHISLNL